MDLNANNALVSSAIGVGAVRHCRAVRSSASATGSDRSVGGYEVLEGGYAAMEDVRAFVAELSAEWLGSGCTDPRVYVARAPGRMDVMGGIADYSGSLVLQMPIAEATFVAVRKNTTRTYRLRTGAVDGGATFELPVAELSRVSSYESARSLFANKSGGDWAAYALGCFVVLSQECGASFTEGCNIQIHSNVPISMSVSSSAAIEVAAMQAITKAFDVSLNRFPGLVPGVPCSRGMKVGMLCQKVENLVVGTPCGIMDQVASNMGEQNRLLALLCRPAEVQGLVGIPAGAEFWGLDSGHKHAVGGHVDQGADYTSVRIGAFMGKKIWNSRQATAETSQQVQYTTDLTPSTFEWVTSSDPAIAPVPESMLGKDFLAKYGSHDDPVTTIEPEREYAVRVPMQVREKMQERSGSDLSRFALPARTKPFVPVHLVILTFTHVRCGAASDIRAQPGADLPEAARDACHANYTRAARRTHAPEPFVMCARTSWSVHNATPHSSLEFVRQGC
jgi:galactokinase